MAISFHCEYCGKKVEAPDNAGGKWGKCPACHNKLYIPAPKNEADEELKLAPINTSDLDREKQLMDETYRLTQDILKEREIPYDGSQEALPETQISEKELTKNIIIYLRMMADGELGSAEKIAQAIASSKDMAKTIIDKLSLSEMPEPELADIAPQVLAGLMRTLRNRL
jgi:hypothetical protein